MRVRSARSILISAAIAPLAFGGALVYVLRPNPTVPVFYQGPSKAWSHRALSDGAPENSPQGLRRAFALGAPGVEIDVIYDARRNGLYVISEEAVAARLPAVLHLTEMLAAVPPHGLVWLDFWNLRTLSDTDAQRATDSLRTELETARMRDRAIVESVDPRRLGAVASLGMRTSLWLQITPTRAGRLAHVRDLLVAGMRFRSASFAAVSLDYMQYDRSVGFVFARVPIHLFTVNDPGTLCELTRDPRVKVILTDSLYFRATGCPA